MVKLTAFKSTTLRQEKRNLLPYNSPNQLIPLRECLLDEMSRVISVPCRWYSHNESVSCIRWSCWEVIFIFGKPIIHQGVSTVKFGPFNLIRFPVIYGINSLKIKLSNALCDLMSDKHLGLECYLNSRCQFCPFSPGGLKSLIESVM